MSVHDDTFKQLRDMGIDAPLARAAALRFTTTDAAVNWCFGEGMNWKPESDSNDELPKYDSARNTSGATVFHHEVREPVESPPYRITSPTPSFGPRTAARHQDSVNPSSSPLPNHRKATSSQPFASNNPFNRIHAPPPPPPDSATTANVTANDEDEELQKALAISVAPPDESDRNERERSVRASGVPPPSPESEEEPVIGTLFGPSENEDREGKMALVPAGQNQKPGGVQTSTEEDDLNRAIAHSLMTASFHSASAPRDAERPVPESRESGAPLVLHSQSGESTYAANLLQGLFAIPQVREAISSSLIGKVDNPKVYLKMTYLQELVERMANESMNFVEVDQTLRELRDGNEPGQLPPGEHTMQLHGALVNLIQEMLSASVQCDAFGVPNSTAVDPYWAETQRLFTSDIESPPSSSTFVQFHRQAGSPLDLYSALASILWTYEAPGSSIVELSDVLTVRLIWDYGATRELWKLEERVILDRFMKGNAEHSAQIRAQQAVAVGNAKRIKTKIESTKMHKEQNFHDSISALIKYYENSPSSDDEVQKQSRIEMKAKLEKTLEVLKSHTAEFEESLDREEKLSSASIFETDDPALNQYSYLLRAALFHDGALVAGEHLYAYVKAEDGKWWKVQEHKCEKTEWESIAGDRTGLFMDGGPYILLYSRDGPRLNKPLPNNESEASSTLVDVDIPSIDTPKSESMGETEANGANGETDTSALLVDVSEEAETKKSAVDGDTDVKMS